MKKPRDDDCLQSSTAMYRRADGADGRPVVALVARSAPVGASELVPRQQPKVRKPLQNKEFCCIYHFCDTGSIPLGSTPLWSLFAQL
jgi:hypothetical protein